MSLISLCLFLVICSAAGSGVGYFFARRHFYARLDQFERIVVEELPPYFVSKTKGGTPLYPPMIETRSLIGGGRIETRESMFRHRLWRIYMGYG